MPEVFIDGQNYNIPDSSVNEKILRDKGKVKDEQIIYKRTSDGKHKTLNPGEEIEVNDGARFGTVSRFIQG